MSTQTPIERDVIVHALLHLLFHRAAISPRYMPTKECNQILVKWLKPKLKRSEYRPAKGLIKELIHKGRRVNSDLEAYLWRLNGSEARTVKSDLDELIVLVNDVEEALQCEFKLVTQNEFKPSLVAEEAALRLQTDDLASHFTSTNNQICKPIQAFYKGNLTKRELFEGLMSKSVFSVSEPQEVEYGFWSICINPE